MYFYNNNDGSDDFLNYEKFVEVLGKILVLFYFMVGWLKWGEGGRVEINCNGEGVFFVEVEVDVKIIDFGEFVLDFCFCYFVF